MRHSTMTLGLMAALPLGLAATLPPTPGYTNPRPSRHAMHARTMAATRATVLTIAEAEEERGGSHTPIPVGGDQETKREIQASYDRLCRASMAKDNRALLRWMEQETTPDYEEKTYSMGSMSRRQKIEEIKRQPWDPSERLTIRITGVNLQGDEATVLTTNEDRERSRDARLTGDATGRPHALTMQITARDTWLKTASGWKMKRHETLTARRTVDGQPRPVPGAPPFRQGDRHGQEPQ